MARTDEDLGHNHKIDQVQISDTILGVTSSSLPPPLGPGVNTTSGTTSYLLEKKMTDMLEQIQKMEEKLSTLEVDVAEVRVASAEMQELSLGWSMKELVICAGEIWRRSVQGRIEAIHDGKQLFDPDPDVQGLVLRAAMAMGMVNQIPVTKEMSQICIIARDERAHYSTVKTLEDSVGLCLNAMKIFPSLQQSHPLECFTISQYLRFKQLFPENFRD